MVITLIVALVLAIIVGIFAIENTDYVSVVFLGRPVVDGSVSLILVIGYLLGVVSGVLLMLPGAIRARAQIMLQKRKIGSLDKPGDKSKG